MASLSWPSAFTAMAALLCLAGPHRPAAAAETLTLYNGQHEQAVSLLVADFTKRTGIAVKVHSGEGPEIANQIATEGTSSPADVYFTENSPELALLDERGLLAPVDPKTLAEVPASDSATDGNWVGVVARESVLVYDPVKLNPAALPKSLLDLASGSWAGKIGIAPSDGDFLPLVSGLSALEGRPTALQWLKGLEANAQSFEDEEGVVAAVDRGAVAAGLVNNYYWARLAQAEGRGKIRAAIYHFPAGDPGAMVNISGAAVLKSSQHKAAAQAFLAYLVSAPAQTLIATTDVMFEYPLRPGIAASGVLKPFDQLQPPSISLSKLGDDSGAAALLREAGLL